MLDLIEDFRGHLRSDFVAQKMPRSQNVHYAKANPRVVSEKSGGLATLHHGEPIEMVTLRHEKS